STPSSSSRCAKIRSDGVLTRISLPYQVVPVAAEVALLDPVFLNLEIRGENLRFVECPRLVHLRPEP
ncbi:MAG: hypothetical protein ACREX8_08325, partial [Gammaproteobacteria bacterium]